MKFLLKPTSIFFLIIYLLSCNQIEKTREKEKMVIDENNNLSKREGLLTKVVGEKINLYEDDNVLEILQICKTQKDTLSPTPYNVINLYPTGVRRTHSDKSYEKYPITKMHYMNTPIDKPMGIVLHFTNTESDDIAIKLLSDTSQANGRKHGAHLLIGRDRNEITVFNDITDITPHAGHSYFLGQPDINNFMLGIEFQGNAHQTLSPQQKFNFAFFLKNLIQKTKIHVENIVTHKQVRNNYIQQYGIRNKNNKIETDNKGYSKTKNPYSGSEEWINSTKDLTDKQYEDLIKYLYNMGIYTK